MPATHILLDTNAYLRLARTIRPLLGQALGEVPYLLSVIPELNKELASNRLQTTFTWVEAQELAAERRFFPQLSRANRKSIKDNFDFLWDHVTTALPGPSRVDATYIAYALELNCKLVTDDRLMRQLAKDFGASTLSTLELLKLMLEQKHSLCRTSPALSAIGSTTTTCQQIFSGSTTGYLVRPECLGKDGWIKRLLR
ncbi:MAG: DNA-binding protein [Pseudohongiellaceae bacterium]